MNQPLFPQAPAIDDPNLLKLLAKVNATHEPIYLDVEPEEGAILSDCFPTVLRKVEQEGGKMILGWQIWKADYLIEAECHAVWETPDEDLMDITPKPADISQIMFVEDDNLKYDGKQIDNIRMNITRNKLVDDLILVAEAIFQFENKGERANLYDLTRALSSEQKEVWLYLKGLKDLINLSLQDNRTRESMCYCDSKKIYKNCHGKDLAKTLKKLII